jgi:hypothetical protein
MVLEHGTIEVYKTKVFARFARKARISDRVLWGVAQAADQGRVDADPGGGVVKQRIARSGQGKSGGSRTIIVLRQSHRAVFVFGFEKKDMTNITAEDLVLFREMAPLYLTASGRQMRQWREAGAIARIEFDHNGEEK